MDFEKKGGSKFHGKICVRLMIHIYEYLVVTEVEVMPRISSVLVSIKKYAMYIYDRKQRK
jgi:hypothetical protein